MYIIANRDINTKSQRIHTVWMLMKPLVMSSLIIYSACKVICFSLHSSKGLLFYFFTRKSWCWKGTKGTRVVIFTCSNGTFMQKQQTTWVFCTKNVLHVFIEIALLRWFLCVLLRKNQDLYCSSAHLQVSYDCVCKLQMSWSNYWSSASLLIYPLTHKIILQQRTFFFIC